MSILDHLSDAQIKGLMTGARRNNNFFWVLLIFCAGILIGAYFW